MRIGSENERKQKHTDIAKNVKKGNFVHNCTSCTNGDKLAYASWGWPRVGSRAINSKPEVSYSI